MTAFTMGMETEFMILGVLILVFIGSFCGLLQKIRKTYEDDRQYTERVTNVSSPRLSLTEIYINPSFAVENETDTNNQNSGGVFPCAPPPYTEIYSEPPPKYEDIIKDPNFRINIPSTSASN